MAAPTLRETREKRAIEVVSVSFEFADVLVTGSTLTGSATVTAQIGLTVVVSAPSPVGSVVTTQISGGVAGEDYWLKCRCAASNGDTHELEVVILVRDDN